MTAPRRIVLFGECMIELRGQVFGAMQQSFGGDTLNTAIYLARLCAGQNLKISYATALGVDVFSEHMIAAWRAEWIDTTLVRLLDSHLPGLTPSRSMPAASAISFIGVIPAPPAAISTPPPRLWKTPSAA